MSQLPRNVELYQPQSARLNGQYSISRRSNLNESHTDSYINQNNTSVLSNQYQNLYANKEPEGAQRPGRRHSLLSNQDDRASRRSVSSSWYSNRQNDFDWIDMAPSDIKSVVVTPEFYVVNVDGDLEDEALNKSQADPSVSDLRLPPQPGQRFDIYSRQQNGVFPSKPEVKPMALNGRILNAEDLRRMVGDEYIEETDSCLEGPFRVYGYNEHRDEVYGFDQFGNTILAFEDRTLRPIYGYLEGSKKAIYGVDQHGHLIIDFDKDRRPVFGYTKNQEPVNFIDRNHLQAYWRDERNQPILGYTDDRKPIFGMLPNGVKALAYDPESKKPIYAFETNGRPLFEEEILFRSKEPIGFGVTGEAVYHDDLHNGPVYGYTREGRPVYGFDSLGNQVLGFGPSDAFIYGSEENGRPVYGYTKEGKPANYLERNSDSILFSRDGKQLPPDNKRLFDQSKKEIPIRGTISPKGGTEKANSAQIHPDKGFGLYGPQGEPLTNPQILYDSSGSPIPTPAVLTNADGKIIDAKSPIRDHTGEVIENPLVFKARSANPDDLLANAKVNKEGFLFSNSGVLLGICDENGVVRNQSGGIVTIKGKMIKKQDGGFASARILSPRDLNPQKGASLGIYKSDYLTKDDLYHRNMTNRLSVDDRDSKIDDLSAISQRNRFKSLTLTNEALTNNAQGKKDEVYFADPVEGKGSKKNLFGKEGPGLLKEKKVNSSFASSFGKNGEGSLKTNDGKVIDEKGKEIGSVTKDGHIVDHFGSVIGSVDREGRIMSQVLDNNSSSTGILPGSFVGNITSGDQNHITFGEIHATAHKSSVDQQIANQNEANMSISDPKKVKEQKSYEKDRSPEEKKSITKIYDSVATEQSPIKLDVLLSVEFKAEKQVLQDTKKAQAELAKALINDEGQVIDSEGNIIGVAAKDGKVLNERGELIGEVSKDGSILPVRTSLFGFQMVDNTVVDERGRVLATVKDNIILGYDGELLATIDKTGQIFNIEGQEIDSSGWLLDLQGGRTAKFGLKCVEEDLIPLPNSNFPLLYDSEGQRIIGINKKGTVSVVQMNEGKGILGSSQSTKEGKKYVVWDSDKRPLSEAQVKNLIKLSAKMQNLNYESSDEEEGLLYQPDDGGLDLEEELRQIGEHRDQYLVKKTSSLVKSNLPLIPANIQDLKYSIKKPQSMSVQSIDQKHLKMGLKLTVGEKFDPLEAQRLLEEKKKSLLETKKKKKTKDDSEADPSKPKKKKKKVDEEGTVPSVKPKKKKVKEGEVADDGVAKKKKKKVDGQEKADESTNKSKLEADELAETENLKPKKKKKVKIEPMGELSEVAPKKKKVLKNSEQINEEMEVPIGAQLEGETKKPLKKPKKPLPSPKSPDPQEDRDKPDRVEEAGNVEKEIKRKKKAGDGKKAGEEVLSEITPKAQKKDKVKEIGDSQAKEKVFGESESVKEEVKVKRVLKKKVANESAEVTGKATDIKKQASDPKPANANVNNPIEGLAPADKTKKPPEVVASKDKELTKPQPRAKNAADYKIGKKIKLPEESKPTGDSSAPGKTSLEAILAKPGQKKDKLAKIDEHMPTKVGVQLLPDPKIESKEKKVKKTK